MKWRNKKNNQEREIELITKETLEESKIKKFLFLFFIFFLSFFIAFLSQAFLFSFIVFVLLFWNFYSIRACNRKLKLILKKIYEKEMEAEIEESDDSEKLKKALSELKELKSKMTKRKIKIKELD